MEKVVYLLWRPEGVESDAFRDRLVDDLSQELHRAGVCGLAISVADSAVAAGDKLRIAGAEPHKDALVSFWLEQSQDVADCEGRIAAASARIAGYLVVESRPIVNREQRAPLGERTPGFSLCTAIAKRGDLERSRFIELWYDVHRAVAIETQSTFSYVRNEIVRPLTDGAPAWDAIVEEGFPIDALDEPEVFYDARGDLARLQTHLDRMMASCDAFIDRSRVSSHPMSQYTFEDLR
ncbi:MAG: hypothetical protein VX681_13430 [Myxococcota bacterium]|nr:hypothetical protein [Myxococcota bacterium]